MWRKYHSLDPIRRLRYAGRELLGKKLFITVKRDGECVNPWLNSEGNVVVGSRGQPVAASDIQNRMKNTPEWDKVQDMLKSELEDYRSRLQPYGELLKHVSPTRIEPKRKHIHWIMFDIWDLDAERWLGYNRVFQYGHKYKIPVVKLLEIATCNTMEELSTMVDTHMKWCRRHRREGIVIKCGNAYGPHDVLVAMGGHPWAYAKEKIDLPKQVKIRRSSENRPLLPAMPEEKIQSALRQAYDVCPPDEWTNPSVAMPLVAKYMATEAREHNYETPKNMFYIWSNTSAEDLRPTKMSVYDRAKQDFKRTLEDLE